MQYNVGCFIIFALLLNILHYADSSDNEWGKHEKRFSLHGFISFWFKTELWNIHFNTISQNQFHILQNKN